MPLLIGLEGRLDSFFGDLLSAFGKCADDLFRASRVDRIKGFAGPIDFIGNNETAKGRR